MSVAVVRGDDGTPVHLIVQIVDLTDRRALEVELRRAAVEDPLTRLANRRALLGHLAEAQQRQGRFVNEVGLLYLDLDDFKAVNDHHGHDVGDRLPRATGEWLVGATRKTDLACRLGGDEFAVLCEPVGRLHGLEEIVDRLHVAPAPSVLVDGQLVTAGYSVGAVLVGSEQGLDEALRGADASMYRSKRDRLDALEC